jgi:hypothetical protein
LAGTIGGKAHQARAADATAQAARAFRAGSDAYERRDFREAARQFESAYRIAPRGAAIYNAGLSWAEAGELAHAADDYATAIGHADATPVQRSDATARLRALEARIARLVVTGPPDARVAIDDGPATSLPLGLHLLPGQHVLRIAYASGATQSRTIAAKAGAEEVVRVSEPAPATSSGSSAPVAAPWGQPDAATGPATRRTLAWVALGGTAFASALAAYFYVQGNSALSRFEAGMNTDAALHDQATTDRTLAQVSSVVAAGLGIAAIVLYVTSAEPSSPPPPASLRVGPGAAALRVAF